MHPQYRIIRELQRRIVVGRAAADDEAEIGGGAGDE